MRWFFIFIGTSFIVVLIGFLYSKIASRLLNKKYKKNE